MWRVLQSRFFKGSTALLATAKFQKDFRVKWNKKLLILFISDTN